MTEPVWQPAAFWHRDGGRLVCDLCPTRCAFPGDGPGACRVRRRAGGRLETSTFATSVWHWQAVERKPFHHVQPGRPTLTLAAPGCTFRCDYCLNAAISQFGREPGVAWTAEPLDPAGAVRAAAGRAAAIALSYSEPTLAAELTLALHRAAGGLGLDVPILWKTNGYLTPEAVAALAPCLTAVNIDLKAPDEASHRRLTGAPLAPVLAAMADLHRRGVWVEVSSPLIPGFNADPGSIARMARLVARLGWQTPWHLVRFLPDFRRRDGVPTPPGLLAEALAIARRCGLHHVYVERALGAAGRATRCPGCGETLIERGLWVLEYDRLEGGACPGCGRPVAGRWR